MKFEKPTLKEWNAAEKLADPVAFKTWVRRLVRRDKRYLKEVAAEVNYRHFYKWRLVSRELHR